MAMNNILRPTASLEELERLAEKAREAEAKRQEEARKAAAARRGDDRASLNLEQALLLMFLALVCIFALTNLGHAVAAKYADASQSLAGAMWGSPQDGTAAPSLTVQVPGTAPAGAFVMVADYWTGDAVRTGLPDASGSVAFADLPAGRYILWVLPQGSIGTWSGLGSLSDFQAVEVVAGQPVATTLTLTGQATAELTVQVAGTVPAGAFVMVADYESGQPIRTGLPDASGHVVFADFSAGSYTVYLCPAGADWAAGIWPLSDSQDVEVSQGQHLAASLTVQ